MGWNARGNVVGAGPGHHCVVMFVRRDGRGARILPPGADVRAIFAFLVSSTNMNVAIVILFWAMLGWKFAFAEFFGGLIIVAIVTLVFSLRFNIATFRATARAVSVGKSGRIIGGTTIIATDTTDGEGDEPVWDALRRASTWGAIAQTAWGDVNMLRTELIIGYLVAGFASALIPAGWLAVGTPRRGQRSVSRVRAAARNRAAHRRRHVRLLDGQRPDRALFDERRNSIGRQYRRSSTATC